MKRREFDNNNNQNFFRGSESSDTNFEMENDFDHEFESSSESKMNKSNKKHNDVSPGNVGGVNASTCQQLADIIGGEVIQSTPVCVVMRLRDIRATILGRRTHSPRS